MWVSNTFLSFSSETTSMILIGMNTLSTCISFCYILATGFETNNHFVLVMEYAAGGDLFSLVDKEDSLKEDKAREIFRGILNGMQHCHENGVTHRDLKPENIMLSKDNKPKVIN